MQKQPLLVNDIIDHAVSIDLLLHPFDMIAWTRPTLVKAASLQRLACIWTSYLPCAGQVPCRAAGLATVMHDHFCRAADQATGAQCSFQSSCRLSRSLWRAGIMLAHTMTSTGGPSSWLWLSRTWASGGLYFFS